MRNSETVHTYSKARNLTRKSLKLAGFSNIKISNGYYYFSGFATKNDKVIYFSISDSRFFTPSKLLLRTATDYKDFSGGTNTYSKLESEWIQKQANRLISS